MLLPLVPAATMLLRDAVGQARGGEPACEGGVRVEMRILVPVHTAVYGRPPGPREGGLPRGTTVSLVLLLCFRVEVVLLAEEIVYVP